jgi:spore coat protein CotH
MTRFAALRTWLAGVAGAVLLVPSLGAAQTADDLFDDGSLHEVRLLLHSADWAKLKAEFEENTYYPADLEWRGLKVRNVGIRSRGLATRNGIKPGLRVDMNRYASGQRFLGLRSILLDNVYRDVSAIHDRMAMKVFAKLGIPAPRISHARLYVNGEYAGLYAVVEELGEDFVRRVFKKAESDEPDKGYLYEYKWIEEWNFRYLGNDLTTYKKRFEARTHEDDSLDELYRPIEELVRRVNETSGDRFVEDVGTRLDLTQFMRFAAVEAFVVDYDGFVGFKGMANFYLYRPEDGRPAVFIPWDKDQAFFVANRDTGHGIGSNELFRRAIDVPELHAVYLDALDEVARLADERQDGASSGWLESEMARQLSQVRDASLADPGRWFGVSDIENERDRMLEFARTRPAFVRCQVENARRSGGAPASCAAPSREAPR